MLAETPPIRRRSRFWLYAPYGLLGLLAIAWSVGWFVVRSRMEDGLDRWVATEARAGRTWTCTDRSIGGYPFRLELRCASFGLQRPDLQASLGPVLAVAQVYNPGHVIAEATGRLHVSAGSTIVDASWALLQTSVHVGGGGPERADLVADKPVVTVTSPDLAPVALAAERLETHLRPDPSEGTTANGAVKVAGAVIPGLDALIGGAEPADLDLVLDVTRARDLPARPLVAELERWREAGGRIAITRLGLAKGPRRAEVTGTLGLDALHRPEGRFEVATLRIEGVLGRFVGGRAGAAAGLLGALLGAPPPQAPPPGLPTNGPPLTPLPPVRLENGKLAVGPFVIPGVRLGPLY